MPQIESVGTGDVVAKLRDAKFNQRRAQGLGRGGAKREVFWAPVQAPAGYAARWRHFAEVLQGPRHQPLGVGQKEQAAGGQRIALAVAMGNEHSCNCCREAQSNATK